MWRCGGPLLEKNVLLGVGERLWCEPRCCSGCGEAVAFPSFNEEMFRGPGNVPGSGRLFNNHRVRRGGWLQGCTAELPAGRAPFPPPQLQLSSCQPEAARVRGEMDGSPSSPLPPLAAG